MAGKLAALTLGVLIACMSTDAGAQAKNDAMARLKLEPSCPEVQKAALRYFNIGKPQVKAFQRGAARKALAPVVEFSGGYASSEIGETSRNFEYGLHNVWLDKGADGWGWDARGKLVWNLPQLVFNAEELDVASLAGLIQGILKEVTRLYYMRRRLQMDLILNPPTDEATRLTKELRLEELTALLDAMTGGYFEKELKKRGAIETGSDAPEMESPF